MTNGLAAISLEDRYLAGGGRVVMTGVQALVRLPLDQHRRDRQAGLRSATLISGYPGSPLAGLDLELGRRSALLGDHHIVHQPAVNEELAATAVQGSQLVSTHPDARYDGVVGIWYGKAPGLDRATDAVRHGNLMGAHRHGGVLVVVGDDATAKSSTLPSASETTLYDCFLPVLSPADPQEVLDLGLHGIAMSRASGLWVGLKVATNVADSFATVDIDPDRVQPRVPEATTLGRPFEHRPTAHMLAPTVLELERTQQHSRLDIARRYATRNGLNAVTAQSPGDRIGLVATGTAYLDLCQALRDLGVAGDLAAHGIRLLKVSVPFPLDPALVREFARGLREIVVIEEKRPFLELFVKDALHGVGPVVLGRRDERDRTLLPSGGALDPDAIAAALGPRLLADHDIPSARARLARLQPDGDPAADPASRRTPYFCSGCPHNSSAPAPAGSLVGGGIGCSAMVLFRSPEQVGTVTGLTQMGGEGAQWIGMAPFTRREHLFQNIGDGTFAHSGSLAVRAAVAAGVNITFKLLYNSAVAMTGGQAAAGLPPVDRLTHLLAAEGVRRIVLTTDDPGAYRGVELAAITEVRHRRHVLEVQRELARVPGVTVLLHVQECAAEKRRKRKRGLAPDPAARMVINERLCEGCGDCGRTSNCLSVRPVDTEFGTKTRIHQPSCNKDYSCLEGDCPSFLTVVPVRREPPSPAGVAPLDPDACPPVDVSRHRQPFAMRISGIGGTGVVTISQVLAAAAALDGLRVRGLDQTGLAQKGGPVVSDLKLADSLAGVAGKLAAGECDLYLACDLLVGAEPKNLDGCDPARTRVVLSTSLVPTGAMVGAPGGPVPDAGGLLARITAHAAAGEAVAFDARAVSEGLFGSDAYANVVLLGAAFQAGALPLRAAAIERAIELNGAAVETNLQAFRRGRQAVSDPESLQAAVSAAGPAPPRPPVPTPEEAAIAARVAAPAGSELGRLVSIRVPDLVGYQDATYARRYADLVERVRRVEADRCPAQSDLAEAVAFHLHRLMAYKDEYEVARLALDPSVQAGVEAEFGPGARLTWNLHPPVLRSLGLGRKIAVGSWFRPGFRVLRGMRSLRHTPLDPFGRTAVRRLERGLVTEYEQLVEEIIGTLAPANHAVAVDLARLPGLVRGYERIKSDSVTEYRRRLEALRTRLAVSRPGGPAPDTVSSTPPA